MQRTSFGDMTCSIARTLEVLGEGWAPLILRDVFVGINRFDALQADLGISRKVLAERLKHLVQHEVLDRRAYTDRPERYEYVLTERGRDLVQVLLVMVGWGDRWLAGAAGPPVLYRHRSCGEIAQADLHCSHCGEPIGPDTIDVLAGPGA